LTLICALKVPSTAAVAVTFTIIAPIEGRTERRPFPTYCVTRGKQEFMLGGGENLLGRDPDARVYIDHPSVSRRHAQISIRSNRATLDLENIGPLRTWTPAMAVLGYLYAKAGRVNEARTVLAEFDDLVRQHRYASGYAIAVIYAGLGDRERVFSYLDAALRERSHWLVWLKRDPRWNEFRPDRRFQNLVRDVGLP
jgi:FHA domain-containing protein